ncbi:YhaN family protein [Microvirga splendida]|uniref:AAA family ATPase n=1 Tax=Microvirga splendida TaxID=2795727 RepID=A0ABS0Y534_9HYPH|nr:YhaN family protein [Microvirga splendida]MBJ6127384.1 AAA family ATPase [Microvirga splendida]
MRFEALHLERYGAFENTTFDFGSADVRLHIVYGPNEAGKSTVLSAIGDLLFGIPARTPYNFRFDYPRLRIGAKISNRAGKTLAFKRRKANTGTLLTLGVNETVLPDAVLAPFLEGVSREQFTRMFGLDHGRLREGGEQMLRSGGDLARSLFEAGSGLSGISGTLQRLEAEIDELGDLDRRAKSKPLWREVNTFEEALQSVRRDGLKAEEWRQAEQTLEKAQADRQRVDQLLVQLRKRRAQLERVRRVTPLLTAIDALAEQLAEFRELPPLPEDFAEEWRRRSQESRETQLALERAEEILRERAIILEQTPQAGPIVSLADAIGGLHENLGRYLKDVADEPKLARDIANDEALIQQHLRSLGLPADPTKVDALVPPMPLVAKIRELIRLGEGIEAAIRTAAADRKKAQDACRVAEERLTALPPVADPAPAAALVEEVSRLGDLASQTSKAERDLANSKQALAEALKRLPRWTDTAEALAERALPDTDTVRLHEEELRQAQERLAAALRAAEGQEEIQRVEAELVGLAAAGEVPSPAAVQAARDHRDRVWRLLRAHHVDGRELTSEDQATLNDLGDVAACYETAVRHADALVDRRESEAHRIVRFSELTAQLTRLRYQQEAAVIARQQAQQALEAAEARWQELWIESGIVPGPAPSMRAWLAQKDEILRLLGAVRQARANADEVQSATARARATLAQAAEFIGLAVDPALSVSDLAQLVRHQIADVQRAWRDRQAAAQRLEDEQSRIREKDAADHSAQAAADDWHATWAEAVVGLGLPATAGRSEAEVALTAWDEIRQRLTNKVQTVRRLEGIRRDNERFRHQLSELVQALGSDGVGLHVDQDPEGTVRTLVSRLSQAQENATRHAQAQDAHTSAIAAVETARRTLQVAVDACHALRNGYGLAPDADVLKVAETVAAHRRCAAELEERRRQLVAASDGLSDHDLRQECASITADTAVAELAALDMEEPRLVEESQVAAQRETSAQHALSELAGRKSVADVAQQARHAAQTAGHHLDRWLRLTAAKQILERSLERYRAENQHPLIRRGSEIFTSMASTGSNPIVRLDVAYGDGSEPTLVGIRQDGSECRVDGMSEGTRDQLFLSLRIAAVEQHVTANEPMPFIADDLFITSDEERVTPGLQALAELGHSTQVILFTHHRHVVAAASSLPAEAVKIHDLAGSHLAGAAELMMAS